jgi:probable rRNA maturation factor
MPIEIHNLQDLMEVDLDLLARAVALSCGCADPDISVSIVDDGSIRTINRSHLGRDRSTDVIAFDYGDDDAGGGPSGEVILSAETALRVAGEKGHAPLSELLLYVVHGVLHLSGHDDLEPSEARRMWARQERIMTELGLSGDFTLP